MAFRMKNKIFTVGIIIFILTGCNLFNSEDKKEIVTEEIKEVTVRSLTELKTAIGDPNVTDLIVIPSDSFNNIDIESDTLENITIGTDDVDANIETLIIDTKNASVQLFAFAEDITIKSVKEEFVIKSIDYEFPSRFNVINSIIIAKEAPFFKLEFDQNTGAINVNVESLKILIWLDGYLYKLYYTKDSEVILETEEPKHMLTPGNQYLDGVKVDRSDDIQVKPVNLVFPF